MPSNSLATTPPGSPAPAATEIPPRHRPLAFVAFVARTTWPQASVAEPLAQAHELLEMAMGSAAYLNELVSQLAQAYLERRQQETGKTIAHERYHTELQKVKMRLADQNVFGVDLNPVAVELAEVSLWLNSIFAPEQGRAFVPWFSQQLVNGNSLIGARRQIYRVSQLQSSKLPTGTGRKAKPTRLWHEHAPEELAWDAALPADGIFHFLLPDPGMAAYSDKEIKELEPDAIGSSAASAGTRRLWAKHSQKRRSTTCCGSASWWMNSGRSGYRT